MFDILGREVSVLVNERRDAGVYDVMFDGSALSSGQKGLRTNSNSKQKKIYLRFVFLVDFLDLLSLGLVFVARYTDFFRFDI